MFDELECELSDCFNKRQMVNLELVLVLPMDFRLETKSTLLAEII